MESFQMIDSENVALYYTHISCWCISLGQHPCQVIYLNSPMLLEFTNVDSVLKIQYYCKLYQFKKAVANVS